MDVEQLKVSKFFDEFINIVGKSKLATVSIVIWIVLLLIGSSIPIQDIMKSIEEFELFGLLPMSMSIIGMFAAHMRISSYETYTEKINSIGSVIILLQYHPINKKKIMKMKLLHQFRFLVKVELLCLAVQLVVTYLSYRTLSWINVGYIFLFVFLLPVFFEGILMRFREKYLYGD